MHGLLRGYHHYSTLKYYKFLKLLYQNLIIIGFSLNFFFRAEYAADASVKIMAFVSIARYLSLYL